jgi:hypothetical protein
MNTDLDFALGYLLLPHNFPSVVHVCSPHLEVFKYLFTFDICCVRLCFVDFTVSIFYYLQNVI